MDTQPTPIQPQPPVQNGQLSPKKNMTRLIIIALLIGALTLAGIVYLILPSSKTGSKSGSEDVSQTTTLNSPTPAPKIVNSVDAQWKRYENSKNKFSFYFPDNWSLIQSQADGFLLRNSGDQKVIEGKIISQQEADALQICKNPEPGKIVCKTYPVTDKIKAPVQTTEKNNIPVETIVLIPRPDQKTLSLKAPESSLDSYQTLHVILYTIKFANENRGFPMQICPESYSADRKTVTYKSATLPAEDIDQEYLKTCKK